MISKAFIPSTRWIVGEKRPEGVEIPILMSACGRMVTVGFGLEEVMLDLRRGHSIIAFERAFRRRGRRVSLVYCVKGSDLGPVKL